ncbi:glycoside hydrolase family 65 protein [Alteribacter natronophilus]|uniref:glycoside hydrolase family 65 protein n=1 Tax=Alteribacter natronophilus TaxID=2583810 RepID=UPI00110E6075|nr:glycosyl hydrolase family 65 protein [Alteribacter natronophilus]TMW72339.1 glycoside hydrolase family 65 protein [Alteribacter natronophilus]
MTWKLTRTELNTDDLLVNESLFATGNGYIGVRGNFEEGYGEGQTSIRGTYLNAFHDITGIEYGEKLHGFPDTQQKLLNVIDGQTLEIYLDGEKFSLFDGEVIDYEQTLHFDRGISERLVHWRSPEGKEVRISFRRLVSFTVKELFALQIRIEPLSEINEARIVSTINGDVSNFTDPNDPRVASGHAKRLEVLKAEHENGQTTVIDRTLESELEVACTAQTQVSLQDAEKEVLKEGGKITETYTLPLKEAVNFTKKNVYTDTLRHGTRVEEEGARVLDEVAAKSFGELAGDQKAYMDAFWKTTDIQIKGDDDLQEGLRFNLFHLLQSVGKDSVSNIAAKGLSGEGYEGHYFWDTEIYMFPVFLMSNPDFAKNLLMHRYSLLDAARERAKEVGHDKGALFPWRTITGNECSAFFPAGTAQYHISADIAYSFIQYYLVTKDEAFLRDYGAEVLFETARLWLDTGHFQNGQFRIDDVTGPDEYTCIVNNNYYTNAMAKHNLAWAVKAYRKLEEEDEGALSKLAEKLGLTGDETDDWALAAEQMYLPYDEERGIHAQDDTFLNKKVWDLDNTPKEKFPLLLNYHPLTLYRYQVCKQADTILAHFLLDEQDLETVRRSYEYYEKVTTHDSSLSYCVFSIMASRLGDGEKAYRYFNKTARLDLDNTHGNTKDGLHMANMGGTWLAIVYGFAGVRVKEDGLVFNPSLPEQWSGLTFRMQYQGSLVEVELGEQDRTSYTVVEGGGLSVSHKGEPIELKQGEKVTL